MSHLPFGRHLVDRGLLSEEQLNEALRLQRSARHPKPLGQLAVSLGWLAEKDLCSALAEHFGVPLVRLGDRPIPAHILRQIATDIVTLYRVVPVEERGEALVVATADPGNVRAIDDLSRLLERPIVVAVCSPDDIARALKQYYSVQLPTVESFIEEARSEYSQSSFSNGSSATSVELFDKEGLDLDTGDDLWRADSSAVARYTESLIAEALRMRASDIHIEPDKETLHVRYRVDGALREAPSPPKRAQATILSRFKIMAGMDITERRLPQDGRVKLEVAGRKTDLRVSTLPAVHGESLVIRVLERARIVHDFAELGIEDEQRETWLALSQQHSGVILVTGPTGSGKTTTLYATIGRLNRDDVKIASVEDPVEFQMDGVSQVQVKPEVGWGFPQALRSLLRQDPNIIVLGEIRDAETARMAIQAALTGHRVFSTLHTNDAASAFTRLIDIGVKPFAVAGGVRAILAQRLVRRICPVCKEPYQPSDEELLALGLGPVSTRLELFHGSGCEACEFTGYSGRIGIYELMVANDKIRGMVVDSRPAAALMRTARAAGMVTLREDAWRKALRGYTTIAEVLDKTAAVEGCVVPV